MVFNRFALKIDAKFEKSGKQLLEKSGTKVEEAMKKEKRESITCKKGNQQQLGFALNVLENLEDAKVFLASNSPQEAKRKISEGTELVQERVKVDKSVYGWATINEYLSDELASDTDNEKCNYRSERRAEKKYRDKQIQSMRN